MKWLLFFLTLAKASFSEEIAVYQEIADICHPTIEELQKIQNYLIAADRPEAKKFGYKEHVTREFRFIGELPEDLPQEIKIAVNSSPDERENCLIIYASVNNRFREGAKRLIAQVERSDYRGHILCRMGGWPDIEGGSLVLAHIPYAFKVSYFKEAQKLGYKRVLYLDCSVVPVVSLNRIFGIIQRNGYFTVENTHLLHPPLMTEEIARIFDLPFGTACSFKSCMAGLFGVDFTNPKAAKAIDEWYKAAKDTGGFYSTQSDQTALSVILNKLGLTAWEPVTILKSPAEYKKHALLMIDRDFCH